MGYDWSTITRVLLYAGICISVTLSRSEFQSIKNCETETHSIIFIAKNVPLVIDDDGNVPLLFDNNWNGSAQTRPIDNFFGRVECLVEISSEKR